MTETDFFIQSGKYALSLMESIAINIKNLVSFLEPLKDMAIEVGLRGILPE